MSRVFSFTPTKQQYSVIIGSLLGDAHLSRLSNGRKHSAFQKNQSADRFEYLGWHKQIFGNVVSSLNKYCNKIKDKCYFRWVLQLKASSYWNDLRNEWYPNGIKIIPKNIKLDPLSVAIWYCDDGSNDVLHRSVKFATYNFTYEECQFLQKSLLDFNIKTFIDNDNVIRVSSDSYKNFIQLVSEHIPWKCFKYKLDYRDSKVVYLNSTEIEEILRLHSQGMGVTEISLKINRSKSSVSSHLRNLLNSTLSLSNTSGIKYVSWDKPRNKWKVQKKIDGKNKVLGRFKTLVEAELALKLTKW